MKTLLSWSSGKDCAWALHLLCQQPDVRVAGLVTTVNAAAARVAMHGTRIELARAQAAAAGLPLIEIDLPYPCDNATYERLMAKCIAAALTKGVQAFAFGDLFLEDIRRYREAKLSETGMRPLFPVWRADTDALAREMIDSGVVAHIVCLDPSRLPRDFAGRRFDREVLRDLPAGVDPCGENGEFHTVVTAGPMFSAAIPVEQGEIVERDRFVYCDFKLAEAVAEPQLNSSPQGESIIAAQVEASA